MTTTVPTVTLNDGNTLPNLGLGTYGLRDEEGIAAMVAAIDSGYRLLDTAFNYENEREVGEAVRRAGVAREDIFVTTKLPGRHQGFDDTLASFEQSRENLGLDYVDLYLIHWPLPRIGKYLESWQAMVALREAGRVRSIGVSNFTEEYLLKLASESGVMPAVNQVELHPRFPQAALREFHSAHGIATQSWSPLAKGNAVTGEAAVIAAAEAHGVTPTQVVLRWHLQNGAAPIPKSANPDRQRENLDVFSFELTDAEVQEISALESGRLWDGDPETHEEF